MTTRAEAKYRISAEDKGSEAFKSFKRNVTSANESVEKFRAVIRLSALAVGAGGLGQAFMASIREGAKFDNVLAGANVHADAFKKTMDQLGYSIARGTAPAFTVAVRHLRELGEAARNAQITPSVQSSWDNFWAALIQPGNARWQAVFAAKLAGERAMLDRLGRSVRQEEQEAQVRAQVAAATKELLTPQQQYNLALAQYVDWLNKGYLLEKEYLALRELTRKKLFPKDDPLIEVPFKQVIVPAEEFELYTDEWHQMLLASTLPSEEDLPLAKTKWGLFLGEIDAAATEAAGGMAQAFTDAIFDVENGFDHLKRYVEGVFRSISDALINRYIAGPLLASLGLAMPQPSLGYDGYSGYSGPIGPTPGGDPMGKALAGAGAGVTVQVNVSAIDTQTGMEFVARHARSIGAVVRREIERGRFRG